MTEARRYRWMALDQVERLEPLAASRGVSERARGPGQFLWQYRRAGGKWHQLPEKWQRKRNAFVARHLQQAMQEGEKLYDPATHGYSRRGLALVMWAFDPRWVVEGRWFVAH